MKFFDIENQFLFAHGEGLLGAYRLIPTEEGLLKSKVAVQSSARVGFRGAAGYQKVLVEGGPPSL
jgi:hypothetical protein